MSGLEHLRSLQEEVRRQRERIEELEAELAYANANLRLTDECPAMDFGRQHRLTAFETRFLAGIFNAYPHVATKPGLMDFIYWDRRTIPEEKILDVFAAHTRRKLRGIVTIETIWGVGYKLTRESHARIVGKREAA